MRRRLALVCAFSARILCAQGPSHARLLDTIPNPGRTTAIAAQDLNGDGVADLVVVRDDGVVFYPAVGHGADIAFAAGTPLLADRRLLTIASPRPELGRPCFSDLDEDGIPDLVVVTSADARSIGSASTLCLRWHRGAGATGFGASSVISAADGKPWLVPDGATALALADWNGDGTVDLLAGIRGGVSLFVGHRGRLAATPTSLDVSAHDVAVHDFDGDGDLDLLTTDGIGSVWLHTRTDGASAPTLAPPQRLMQVVGADVLAFAVMPLGRDGVGIVTATRRDRDVLPPVGLSPEEEIRLELAEALVAQLEAKLRKLSELTPADFTPQTLRARKELRAEMESWVARPRQVGRELHRKREPAPAPFRFELHWR